MIFVFENVTVPGELAGEIPELDSDSDPLTGINPNSILSHVLVQHNRRTLSLLEGFNSANMIVEYLLSGQFWAANFFAVVATIFDAVTAVPSYDSGPAILIVDRFELC